MEQDVNAKEEYHVGVNAVRAGGNKGTGVQINYKLLVRWAALLCYLGEL